jgi:GNAT superfamily N-acetyltransferase
MQQQLTPGELAGFLWSWWQGDALPALPPLANFTVGEASDQELLANIMEVSPTTIDCRIEAGHYPYLARLGGALAAFGWSSSGQAGFGGGLVTFQVPPKNRYLYDFVTLPTWRGLGIYPHLLQAILRHEGNEHERFWIVHQARNHASERGINKAGFHKTCQVHFLTSETLGLVAAPGESARARVGAALLDLPLIGH